jgi:hypothetical protein
MSLHLTDLFDGCFGDHSNHFVGSYYLEEVTFIIISILLVYVYLRVIFCQKNGLMGNVNNESLDILMQPKKKVSIGIEKPPFSQFSLKTVYLIFGILILFLVVVFYVIRNFLYYR